MGLFFVFFLESEALRDLIRRVLLIDITWREKMTDKQVIGGIVAVDFLEKVREDRDALKLLNREQLIRFIEFAVHPRNDYDDFSGVDLEGADLEDRTLQELIFEELISRVSALKELKFFR